MMFIGCSWWYTALVSVVSCMDLECLYLLSTSVHHTLQPAQGHTTASMRYTSSGPIQMPNCPTCLLQVYYWTALLPNDGLYLTFIYSLPIMEMSLVFGQVKNVLFVDLLLSAKQCTLRLMYNIQLYNFYKIDYWICSEDQ